MRLASSRSARQPVAGAELAAVDAAADLLDHLGGRRRQLGRRRCRHRRHQPPARFARTAVTPATNASTSAGAGVPCRHPPHLVARPRPRCRRSTTPAARRSRRPAAREHAVDHRAARQLDARGLRRRASPSCRGHVVGVRRELAATDRPRAARGTARRCSASSTAAARAACARTWRCSASAGSAEHDGLAVHHPVLRAAEREHIDAGIDGEAAQVATRARRRRWRCARRRGGRSMPCRCAVVARARAISSRRVERADSVDCVIDTHLRLRVVLVAQPAP